MIRNRKRDFEFRLNFPCVGQKCMQMNMKKKVFIGSDVRCNQSKRPVDAERNIDLTAEF